MLLRIVLGIFKYFREQLQFLLLIILKKVLFILNLKWDWVYFNLKKYILKLFGNYNCKCMNLFNIKYNFIRSREHSENFMMKFETKHVNV